MGKPSIVYQVLQRLDSLESYNFSKRAERMGLAETTGGKYRTTRAPGIYSHDTKETYKKHCLSMVNWVRDRYGVKTLDKVSFGHVREWLESRRQNGDRPSSLKTYGAAAAKLFGVDYRAFGFDYPPVSIKDIQRGRVSTRENTVYGENHPLVRDFARAIGPRKHRELERITVDQFYTNERGDFIFLYLQGKNGKWRVIEPLQADWAQKAVWKVYEMAKKLGSGVPVFPKVDRSWNVHKERAFYAKSKYYELARVENRPRELLWIRRDGEVLDKWALGEVSRFLGHVRYEVVRYNYWYAF